MMVDLLEWTFCPAFGHQPLLVSSLSVASRAELLAPGTTFLGAPNSSDCEGVQSLVFPLNSEESLRPVLLLPVSTLPLSSTHSCCPPCLPAVLVPSTHVCHTPARDLLPKPQPRRPILNTVLTEQNFMSVHHEDVSKTDDITLQGISHSLCNK